MKIIDYSSVETFARNVAKDLNNLIFDQKTLGKKPSILISGGTSPKSVLQCLRETNIDYSLANFTTTDERDVERESVHCNANQMNFLSPLWLCSDNILTTLEQWSWPADLTILGFGQQDGHIASLFCEKDRQKRGAKLVHTIAPYKPTHRISFSYDVIKASKSIWVLAPDKNKSAMLSRILKGEVPNAALSHLLRDAKKNITIHQVL